jgi:hypothetical protein
MEMEFVCSTTSVRVVLHEDKNSKKMELVPKAPELCGFVAQLAAPYYYKTL